METVIWGSGGSRRGARPIPPPPALNFRPNWGSRGRKKIYFETAPPPLSQGLDKAARIILDLPHAHLLVMLQRNYIGNHYCAEEPSTAPFLFINQLITFFLMPFNLVWIVIFIIMIPDLGKILGKPQPNEGGAIGPVSTFVKRLFCRLSLFTKTTSWLSELLLISNVRSFSLWFLQLSLPNWCYAHSYIGQKISCSEQTNADESLIWLVETALLVSNLRDDYSVKMVFLRRFSPLSVSQLANKKQGEQYKTYKVPTRLQTFHIKR